MEAGYDYLLLRGRVQRKLLRYAGILVFIFGAVLLASGGAYYGYAAKAKADLDDLNVTLPGGAAGLAQFPDSSVTDPDGGEPARVTTLSKDDPGTQWAPAPAKVLPRLSKSAIGRQQLYPGDALSPSSWSNPWSYEPRAYWTQQFLQGFTPVDPGQTPPSGTLVAATRLILPSIDVDTTVKELEILEMGDSRAYETPDRVVGHIPETANAGETGSSWFFGHTESPILGEGSVFFNLRKVPDKLRRGEDVFIIAENGQHQFLYRITSSQVVHQDDMKLYDTGQATIHLVSCVPRLVYDHRLIITGELMGEKSAY